MKFKVIAGYPGTPERMLAVERGELDGSAAFRFRPSGPSSPSRRPSGKIRLIAQASTRKDPRYPDVPNILDQAKTPKLRSGA